MAKTMLPLLLMILLFGCKTTSTTNDNSLKAQLKVISREMYEAGNEKYLVVDAIKDGLITPGKAYDIHYMSCKYLTIHTADSTINQTRSVSHVDDRGNKTIGELNSGVFLPPALKEQYCSKLLKFFSLLQEDHNVINIKSK